MSLVPAPEGEVRLVPSVPEAFADVVSATVAAASATGTEGRPSLFLSGGSTAEACYATLAQTGGIAWDDVELFVGDERCVPQDDPRSNFGMIRHTLLERIAPPAAVHPPFAGGDPDEAAAAYQDLLAPLSHFTLVHLGLGPDGHCASLFPRAASLDISDPAHLFVATEDPTGRNPLPRVTLTYPAIARADLVVFTVSGHEKHDAWARVLQGDDLPATHVAATRVVWLVDAEAAGTLGQVVVGS